MSIGNLLEHLTELPKTGAKGSTIEWSIDSGHTENLIDGKVYNNTNKDISVTLFAIFSYGSYVSDEQEYKITIGAGNTSTDEVAAYYNSITETTGNALKTQLASLITETHTKTTSYEDCKTHLQLADADPNDSSKIILFYTGESINGTWNSSVWNREHVWPQSVGWSDNTVAGADLHHVRPCSYSLNSSRGNKPYGEGTGYFYPYNVDNSGADYRGDVARIIFYLLVRYGNPTNETVLDVAQSLEMLLEWNQLDPVDSGEIARNNYIVTVQGNRNPFIDKPEYADAIWG